MIFSATEQCYVLNAEDSVGIISKFFGDSMGIFGF